MKKILMLSVPLVIIAGVIWVYPSSNSAQQIAEPATDGVDVGQIERNANRNTALSFDDHHQRYMGVLDVLRDYPGP
jgi:hypothetical protein